MPENHISGEMINQFLLAGLPQSVASEVAAHLKECSECRCRMELLQFWGGFSGTDEPPKQPRPA